MKTPVYPVVFFMFVKCSALTSMSRTFSCFGLRWDVLPESTNWLLNDCKKQQQKTISIPNKHHKFIYITPI